MSSIDSFYCSSSFRAFFKKSPQSVIVKANFPYFTVLAVSDKYLEYTYLKPEELLQKNLFEVFTGNTAADLNNPESVISSFKRVIDRKQPEFQAEFPYDLFLPQISKYQTRYWTNLNEPILDEQGEVAYIIHTTTDITEQVLVRQAVGNLEEELKRAKKSRLDALAKLAQTTESLDLALETAHMGVWTADPETDLLIMSEQGMKANGISPGTSLSFSHTATLVSPEFREKVLASIGGALEKGENFDEEYIINPADGSEPRWLRITGKALLLQTEKRPFVLGTIQDISKRKDSERQKDEFISTVSHELKTPVSSIKAYTQLLNRSLMKDNSTGNKGFLNRMEVQVNRLETLIRDLLDATRVESGKLELKEEIFEMGKLVSELIDDLQVIVSSHKLVITKNQSIRVRTDRERIIQVISNLINNAVKYSPGAAEILIALRNEEDRLIFSVQDFGLGISDEQKPFIFKRFHQAQQSNSGAGLNLGLGLYISKEIIERAGGEIWFESEFGKGSIFFFSLPCCA